MLPLATTTWDEKEYQALQTVIDSGMFSMGKYVAEFEKQFAEFVGSKYCVMVNSGSSANLLTIASMFYRSENPLKAGDEVIVPAVSWSTTYYPLYQYGLKIKFVDINKDTLNLDLEQLEAAISDNTRAIFAVNLLGNPLDYQKLETIISGKNIELLEDNCESLGATLNGKQAGTFGLMGTYSSFFSHHISTMEGGLVVTDDEELYHIMLSVRSHGWTRHLPKENKLCVKSDNPFEESFRFILPGYNLRPLDMSGALGIEQLKKIPSIVAGRRKNAVAFRNIFSQIEGISIQQETGESSWFGFAIIVEAGKNKRDELAKALADNGVECRPIVAGNFVRNPVVEYFDYEVQGTLKSSDMISDCGLFIGNHHYDVTENLEQVAKLLNSVI
ncbi:DegT/DnrJ/EryC1/StrS aminotransferase [Vibrio nigripulchritudo SO65]|uniref:DegT/DnrJ/EryC1/StrS family aminotransferase n=1 Tax=Vibrio nigripulchritudo TaxID=28173 RepID=UPI0003B1A2B4|nr:DegT/DnrJ/EryC1/StrS family aminotransferase [Vibrio nigripulchritudo]CCN35034.1 DegT/DnrJ/EryC1/StrS aminotransferase [Vibrio nigripulchritudo AM115]CCN41684.1 DegT/DnrJ/EryC1/StrS aminotransferase [Vibrio nigripulchritudo FTn2]CCN65063.1 DegT/DnrJ/EryC1/StrS aminotransferase [Vibrio nigripulchritudo POn4]CCN74001.1 DegT/DnrJ/EryC1/StrS aminotransferase [Vibrio nigripulchritudo SO65]